ncbi:MAG: class I SAM-dependent methyltransferase [Eubacteriales bacterium]|nr:class I SAM-dependent methyltransferase [Eubacteriales bacterium]
MDSYTNFAYVYDTFMDQEPYEEWADRVCSLLDLYGIPRKADGDPDREVFKDTGGDACRDADRDASAGENAVSDRRDFTGENAFLGADCPAETDLPAQEDRFEEEKNIVVDLGCGTGKLTEILASRGYDMIGVDLSEDMLSIALQRRIRNGSNTLYTLQDMRDFELYGAAGAMVSVGDSINYLLQESDLTAMFRCVERALLPGGVFVFDFKTIHLYRDVIGNRTIAEDDESCAFIWDNYYDPETCVNEYDLRIFVSKEILEENRGDNPEPDGDGQPPEEDGALFRRFHEIHYQRGYEPEQLRHAAETAGLSWVLAQDAETGGEITPDTERAMAVVRRKDR